MEEIIRLWRRFNSERTDMYKEYPELLPHVPKPDFCDFMEWLSKNTPL